MSEPMHVIRAFVVENFLFGEAGALTDDASLLDEGVIDSTGVLELVAFLEEEYEISVEDSELVPENLDSIAAIGAYVVRKQA